MNKIERFIYLKTFSADDRREIYDSFGQYLLDGVSAEDTFIRLIDSYTRRGKKPSNPVAKILKECSENLSAGDTLAQSFRDWLPEQELSIIESCDNAGKTAEGFANARTIAEGTARILSAVRSSAMITSYMIFLALGIISLFCILLVPVLRQSIPLTQWSGFQLAIYYVYIGVTDYYWIILSAMAIFFYLVSKSIPSWTGHLRFHADKFPPYSVYRRLQGATFIMNVNAMLSVGISMEETIRKMYTSCRSDWLAERLEAVMIAIESGEQNLGMALDVTGYEFPGEDAIVKMQSLFETSKPGASLSRFASRWLDKTITDVEKTGDRVRIVSLFSCGVVISLLIIIMFDLIQRAFFFN